MIHYLAIQNTYDTLDIALFKNKEALEIVTEDKIYASKNCALIISDVLNKQKLMFDDLSFIAVNQGPGPFTTLRTVIATANGLSFASGVPLIGIDAIDALLLEHKDTKYPHTVALLNAFNKDVYFGFETPHSARVTKGYGPISDIINKIKETYGSTEIRFIGNATTLYKNEIESTYDKKALFPSQLIDTCSIKQIGVMGLDHWLKKTGLAKQLMPLYLKQSIAGSVV